MKEILDGIFESRYIVDGNFLIQPITSRGATLSAGRLSATICSERKPPCIHSITRRVLRVIRPPVIINCHRGDDIYPAAATDGHPQTVPPLAAGPRSGRTARLDAFNGVRSSPDAAEIHISRRCREKLRCNHPSFQVKRHGTKEIGTSLEITA